MMNEEDLTLLLEVLRLLAELNHEQQKHFLSIAALLCEDAKQAD